MPLDEANALVTVLLEEEADPERRARLVALRLALGYPYALETTPEELAELRRRENGGELALWRARIWLGAASVLSFGWNALGTLLAGIYTLGDTPLVILLAGFLIGLAHAGAGLIEAYGAVPPTRGVVRALAWMWLLGPAFGVISGIGFDREAFYGALFCAAPSMLVSLAAWSVARHTAAR